MTNLKIYLILLFFTTGIASSAQVKIRLFANQKSGSVLFTVNKGKYSLNDFKGEPVVFSEGDMLILALYNGKVAVKTINNKATLADSVLLEGRSSSNEFSLRLNGNKPLRQNYSGDLKCNPDLGALLLLNSVDIETYIAGVVRSEGGSGKSAEYFKTQAVIARTYMYRYLNKHLNDGYNLCDNTHCQAFNGITYDSLISRAAEETRGLVILGPDSTLIISAFHSNCGGETSPSEYVWLTDQSYLKKIADPYCRTSRNALWQKSLSLNAWKECLRKNGFSGNIIDDRLLNFSQPTRTMSYNIGSVSIPFRQLRSDLNLRSAFFSATIDGDSVVLKGKGYGHGVGLCQEGAMAMAAKGLDYKQIIGFYYPGVFVTDIKNAVTIQQGSK